MRIVCNCNHYPEVHYHTPGGVVDTEMEAVGLKVLPFRPGKTRKDRRGSSDSNHRRVFAGGTAQVRTGKRSLKV